MDDAGSARAGRLCDGAEPDAGDAGTAVHHDRDECRSVHGPMADHRVHAGERHHDPHHGVSAGSVLHAEAVRVLDELVCRGHAVGGRGPQLPGASGRPSRAGRRRRHPHAGDHDRAHAGVSRGSPRLGHGIFGLVIAFAPPSPHGGGLRHRPSRLAHPVLPHLRLVHRHHRPVAVPGGQQGARRTRATRCSTRCRWPFPPWASG